ncbi:MAG: hypothetical protein JWR15_919 [Prosthecobacter sp.]|nr:hypothetical protein [Prosthecobacter sp.]
MGAATPSYARPSPFHDQRRIVSYLPGHIPVYAVYQMVGRDRWGHPMYRWVTQPAVPMHRNPHDHGHWHR